MSILTIIGLITSNWSTILAVAGLAAAVYKHFKAKDSADKMILSQDTLKGIVAVIQTLPQNTTTIELKDNIQKMAIQLGTEDSQLSKTVAEIKALFAASGIKSDGDTATVLRAAAAIQEAKNAK